MENKNITKPIQINGKEVDKTQILVVDDQKPLLRLIKRYFSDFNYEIFTAGHGEEAVDILENKDINFDLVILDIMMPVMNGYEVCRRIREKYSIFELPVMFITAKNELEDLIEGFDAGGNDFLKKPFESSELLARANTLIKLKKITESNNVLQDAIRLKNQFLHMNIHDLKNPLTSILINAEMIRNNFDEDSDEGFSLNLINESANKMKKLIDQILEISRIESGKITIQKDKINIAEVLQEVIYINQGLANKKEQLIKFDRETAKTLFIYADWEKAHRIFDNIVGNAIKYCPKNSEINIFPRQSNRNDKNTVIVEIRDNGPGIKEEEIPKVFNKFEKLSSRPTGGESSTGLGMAITKEFVEMHKGRIWVESEFGKGTSFFVELYSENV